MLVVLEQQRVAVPTAVTYNGQWFPGVESPHQHRLRVVEQLAQSSDVLVVPVPVTVPFQQPVHPSFTALFKQVLLGHPMPVDVHVCVANVFHDIANFRRVSVLGVVRQSVRPESLKKSNLTKIIVTIEYYNSYKLSIGYT